MPSNDRPDLVRVPFLVPLFCVPAEFEIDAVEECAFVRFGHGKEGAQLEAVQRRTVVLGDAVEWHVQAELEPLRDAKGPLRNANIGVIGNKTAGKGRLFGAFRREVLMPGEIEFPDVSEAPVVDLDLVSLGECRYGD